jgi:hypothetical protein
VLRRKVVDDVDEWSGASRKRSKGAGELDSTGSSLHQYTTPRPRSLG